jgi:hypothetical protein
MLFIIIMLHGKEDRIASISEGRGWGAVPSGRENEILVEAYHAMIMRRQTIIPCNRRQ